MHQMYQTPKLHHDRWFPLFLSLSMKRISFVQSGKTRNSPRSPSPHPPPFDPQTEVIVMAGEATSKFVAWQRGHVPSPVRFASILSTFVSIEQDTKGGGERERGGGARNSAWVENQCLPDGEIKLKLVSISLPAFAGVSGLFAPVSPFSIPPRVIVSANPRGKIISSFV